MALTFAVNYVTFSNLTEVMKNSFSTQNGIVLVITNNFVFLTASFFPAEKFGEGANTNYLFTFIHQYRLA